MPNWKRTRTPQWTRWNSGPRRRIKIAQPVDRPVRYRRKDVLQWEEIRGKDPTWYTLHKRGIKRTPVGQDQLEARAISKEYIRGTLPERIVYKFMTEKLRLADGVEFDFQSSLAGGRLELGGIVADFLFPIKMMVLQVQGPTHTGFLRMRKDEEQRGMLESMGYSVVFLDEELIYNETKFDEEMRKIFGLNRSSGGGSYEREAQETVSAPAVTPVPPRAAPDNPTTAPTQPTPMTVVDVCMSAPSQPLPPPSIPRAVATSTPITDARLSPVVEGVAKLVRTFEEIKWQL